MKIAILNQKGGVGKTTVSVNLAHGLARAGKRTLLIDLDPQAHSSVIFCAEISKEATVKELFEKRGVDIRPLVRPAAMGGSEIPNLSIVPSNIHLAVTAEHMISQHYREKRLDQTLGRIGAEYDYVLLDCPPNLGVITVNAIFAADRILIPTTYGRYSLDGIADLFASIEEIRENTTGVCSILRNAFDSRNKATNEYIEQQLDHVRGSVLSTVLRKSEAINQAQISGETIFTYDPKGNGAQDFEALTQELMSHG